MKWANFAAVWEGELAQRAYEAVWVVDDDIQMPPARVNAMFQLFLRCEDSSTANLPNALCTHNLGDGEFLFILI